MGQAWLVTIPSSGDSNDNLLTAPSSPGDGSALRSQGQDARECLGADAKQASWKGRQAALPGARTCAAFGPKLCAPSFILPPPPTVPTERPWLTTPTRLLDPANWIRGRLWLKLGQSDSLS